MKTYRWSPNTVATVGTSVAVALTLLALAICTSAMLGCQPFSGGGYRSQGSDWVKTGDPEHRRIKIDAYGPGIHMNQYGEAVEIKVQR